MSRKHLEFGAAGEALAAQWYQQRGYEVLDRNWRCPDGELDLVLLAPDGAVVFTEVKARSSARFGVPAEAVTAGKQRRLRTLAVQYLRAHPQLRDHDGSRGRSGGHGGRGGGRGNAIRFDIVSVLGRQVEVLQAAF